MMRLRVEELLDTASVDYTIHEETYLNYYSLTNLYFNDDETVCHLIYDKIILSTFACGMISLQGDTIENFIYDIMNGL